VKALFDTNILIDYLSAVPQARTELRKYSEKAISIITWMEVMIGADAAVEDATRAFLRSFDIVGLDAAVADRAVALRRGSKIKLPDAIIWASAQDNGMLLVTRNTKDFPANDPGVRHPYVV
jgi:predicted nucleic acid-binding protein